MRIALMFLLVTLLVTATVSVPSADPYLGFVTVSGSTNGDDLGPSPQMLGEALLYSGATCVRAGGGEVAHFPLAGRPGIVYVDHDVSSDEVAYYNSLGYTHFIFENEPDGTGLSNPDWAEDYMSRLTGSYPVIKGVSPSNVVIGGNLFTPSFDELYSFGLKTSSDMIGYHNYSNDPATGLAIGAVGPVRDQMTAAGDSAKKIFLGEGWGPMRELPGLKRLFPDADITWAEIDTLRQFVTNGYWNIVTSKSGYDPSWVWAVLFFTLNDNWGGKHWADRAVPQYDAYGNIVNYTVDGYSVGLDIWAHFYNGGLVDIMGNSKDNLMDVFPGRGLSVNNSGFEYVDWNADPSVGAGWTPRVSPAAAERYAVDASIRRAGQQSQRLTLTGSTFESVSSTTVKGSVTPGQSYSATGWARTYDIVKGGSAGVMLWLQFVSSSGSTVGATSASAMLSGSTDWTKLQATATAPAGADRIRVTCVASGSSGRAWFDDVMVAQGAADQLSAIRGFVQDEERGAVAGALVTIADTGVTATTDSAGRYSLTGISPGVYDITASCPGYATRTVVAQVAAPGRTRPVGLTLPKADDLDPTGLTVKDPGLSGLLKLDWQAPSEPYDFFRVYRSIDPAQLGALAYNNVSGTSLWDSSLYDGIKYCYTVRAVRGGQETTNRGSFYGIPSGGSTENSYSFYAGTQWGHWGNDFGQTFKATATGSLSAASCTPGFGGGGGAMITFRIRLGGPTGAQIGPDRTVGGAGDSECTATWNQGEVPVVSGQTYYLQVTSQSGFAAYRGANGYANGTFYWNGSAVSGSDMWSTISIAKSIKMKLTDVTASEQQPGKVTIRWRTNGPATSQVEYGQTQSYGSVTEPALAKVTDHEMAVDSLLPDTLYHYRVRSTRPGAVDAVSLDYVFRTAPAVTVDSPAAAKGYSDGTPISLSAVTTAAFDGFFYVSRSDRSSGVRVEMDDHGLQPGQIASIVGRMATNSDGERSIEALIVSAENSSEVRPLGMSGSTLGGQGWMAEGGVGQAGISGSIGLSNVGQLVSVWGRVTSVGSGYVVIDDGAARAGASGLGIRIDLHGAASPAAGSYIKVTGASSCIRSGDSIYPRIHAVAIEQLAP